MSQIKSRLKLWWNKKLIDHSVSKTLKPVSSGGFVIPITTFILKATILLFFGMLIIFPFYYMMATALMTVEETRTPEPNLAPDKAMWGNFKDAFAEGYWDALLLNFMVTAASIVLKIFITMLMGYAFSIRNWRFKKLIWTFFLGLLMIPEVALLYGQYEVVVKLKLQVGWQVMIALFLPFVASVFSAFMFKNAFESIPKRTREAALVDGTGGFKYFAKIAMPMVSPTTWTVVILTGFAAWNSYMWPSLLLTGTGKETITTWLFTTGLQSEGGDSRIMMNIRMAAAVLAILPMFIVYFAFRSRIMRAISRQGSAIKG